MIWTESHGAPGSQISGTVGPDKGFVQCVLNEASTAATRGEVAIWDTAATGGNRGIYVKRSTAALSQLMVAGIFEDAMVAGPDTTVIGLIQLYGFHDAVDYSAAPTVGRRIQTSGTAGKALETAASPTALEAAASFGVAIQATDPGAAILHVHL